MYSVLNGDPGTSLSLREEVAAAVKGMIYLSESEAPLELMDWGEVMDLAALQQRIGTLHGVQPQAQIVASGDDFLARMLAACDPADIVLKEYAAKYRVLFGTLHRHSNEFRVIQAGHNKVHIYIASFGKEDSLILHTTAIET